MRCADPSCLVALFVGFFARARQTVLRACHSAPHRHSPGLEHGRHPARPLGQSLGFAGNVGLLELRQPVDVFRRDLRDGFQDRAICHRGQSHLRVPCEFDRQRRRAVRARAPRLMRTQGAELAVLRSQAMRLRIAVIVGKTSRAWECEDRIASMARVPGLQRRTALARRVEQLIERVHERIRSAGKRHRCRG